MLNLTMKIIYVRLIMTNKHYENSFDNIKNIYNALTKRIHETKIQNEENFNI